MSPTTTKRVITAACAILTAACAADAQVFYAGWAHAPDGAATLALNTFGDLVVSNIGSSGLDGVTSDYPTAEAHHTEWTGLNINDPGFWFEQVVTSELSDGSEIVTHRIEVENFGGSIRLIAGNDALGAPGGPGLTDVRVVVSLHGVIQGSVVVPQGVVAQMNAPGGGFLIGGGADTASDTHGHAWLEFSIPGRTTFPVEFEFASGLILLGDEVFTGPVGGPLPSPIVGVTKTQLLVGNIPELVLTHEVRISQRLRHRGLGAAHIDPSGACAKCMVISNIGLSGDDGVEFDLRAQVPDPVTPPEPVRGFLIATPTANAMKIRPLGDRIIVRAVGDTDDSPAFVETEFLSLSLSGDVGGVSVVPDFSLLGATGMRVEAYRDGLLVAGADLPLGPAAEIEYHPVTGRVATFWIAADIAETHPTLGPVIVSMGTIASNPWQLTIPGGASVLADALHMSPTGNATLPTEMLSMQLSGVNLLPFDVDVARTGQTPKTDFGSVVKKGALRTDVESIVDASGQTQKVIVRRWNPEEKEAFVGKIPSTQGVEVSLRFDRVVGAIHACGFDTQNPDTGAAESLSLYYEVLAGDRVMVCQDPMIPFSPVVGIVEARLGGVAVARNVLAPPFPTDLAEIQLAPGTDIGLTLSARGFGNDGFSIFYEMTFDDMTGVMLPGATFPVAADELMVEYHGLSSNLYPFTKLSVGPDTADSGDLVIEGMNLIAHEATHTAQGTGVFAADPVQPASKKLFVGGLSWGDDDDGVAVSVHSLGIFHEHQPPAGTPEVDDEVLVTFADGDPVRPIVIGSLYNAEFKTAPNGAAGTTMAELRGVRTAAGHELSLMLPLALPDHTVTVLLAGSEVGSYVVFGDGLIAKLPPFPTPPPTPDGIIALGGSTSDADGMFRVKVQFPWVRSVESPDGLIALAGDEMIITAPPVPSRFAPFDPVRELRLTGMHMPALAISDVRSDRTLCRADVTTQGAAIGDPGFGVPDGLATASDINFYVNAWGGGNDVIADLTTQGAASGDALFGVPDGLATASDINFYVNLWVAGCQ